jgi:hypothetical protein
MRGHCAWPLLSPLLWLAVPCCNWRIGGWQREEKGFQICQTSPPGETNPGASHRRTLEPPPCFGAACLWDLGVSVISVFYLKNIKIIFF